MEQYLDSPIWSGLMTGNSHLAIGNNRVRYFPPRVPPGNYPEISAVCTHPHCLGRGFGKRLLWHQIKLIKEAGKLPVLHVKSDNPGAVGLYKSLGFCFRRQFDVIVFSQE